MSYQALYRKYRPLTFDEVIGQDAVATTLKNQVKSDRIGHAYLFCGTRGTGKTSLAKIFARAVNCPDAQAHGGNPCNECKSCTDMLGGSSMDIYEIDAASNNGVDSIREIREQVEYPPVEGRFKVYIIDEVHMLSTGAANALLKTLEEPPAYVIFILATTDPQKIPATILSRCQRYDFRRITKSDITGHILDLCRRESVSIEEKAAAFIAGAADGSMRDALSLLDQCIAYHMGETLTYAHVLEILGAGDASVYSDLYRTILSANVESALDITETVLSRGTEVTQLVNDFIWYLRNVLLLSGRGVSPDLVDLNEDGIRLAREDAGFAAGAELIRIMSDLAELANRLRNAQQKKVLLEVELIRLCGQHIRQKVDPRINVNIADPVTEEAPKPVQKSAEEIVQSPGQTGAAEPAQEPEQEMQTSAAAPAAMPADDEVPFEGSVVVGVGSVTGAARASEMPVIEPINEDLEAEKTVVTDVEKAPEADAKSPLAEKAEVTEQKAPASQKAPAAPAKSEYTFLDIVRDNWDFLMSELSPSNRSLFSSVVTTQEKDKIVLVFTNKFNYKLAATNRDENGLTRLRQVCKDKMGLNITFTAREAVPGEFAQADNRVTDEELAKIRFHIDVE